MQISDERFPEINFKSEIGAPLTAPKSIQTVRSGRKFSHPATTFRHSVIFLSLKHEKGDEINFIKSKKAAFYNQIKYFKTYLANIIIDHYICCQNIQIQAQVQTIQVTRLNQKQ